MRDVTLNESCEKSASEESKLAVHFQAQMQMSEPKFLSDQSGMS